VSRPVAALDLGGTHISAGRVDLEHVRVDESVRIALAPGAGRDALVARIVRAATEVAGDADRVGFAVPGPFDYANGVSWIGHKLEALYGVDLRVPLADGLGLPRRAVRFVNDADAFVLGEWWAGAARERRRVVGVTLGTGIGSAFLADGEIVDSGPDVPPAGEIHRVSYQGSPVERAVSRAALIERYGVPEVDVEEIASRARAGDERAVAAFHEVATSLGHALEPWLRAFAAECLVVGGAIAAAWDLLRPGLAAALDELAELETIVRTTLLGDAALLGAAYHASERHDRAPRASRRVARPLHELTVAEARAAQAAEQPPRGSDAYELETHDLAGPVPIRLYRPSSREPLPVCVWLPGGGWVLDTSAAAEPACRRIAAETPCAVAAVRYRLAPEHRFPIPLDDCLAATLWLLDEAPALGLDPRRVAIGGTSAGANLAAALTLLGREREGLDLVAQVLVYPLLHQGAPHEEPADGLGFDARDVDWCWSHYLKRPEDGSSPLASPLLADDLAGLPPALVVTAGLDPLRDEAERYADRLRRAGSRAELVRYDGVPHGFFADAGVLAAADAAQVAVVDALRAAFSTSPTAGLPD
jgi:acetyl esterase